MTDPDQIAAIMHTIPLGAKLSVLIAWALGIFIGGLVGIKLSGNWAHAATIVAGVFLLGAIYTMFTIPHPLWMMIATPIVTILAWYGARKGGLKPA